MNIFFLANHYPEERCIINKVDDACYINISERKSLKSILEWLWIKFESTIGKCRKEKTLPVYWKCKYDGVIHTFNSTVFGKSKWCCNFETTMPRTNYTRKCFPRIVGPNKEEADDLTLKLVKQLTKKNCLRCMALSKATRHIQFSFLDSLLGYLSKEEIDVIKEKTFVLHPPQKRLISDEEIIQKFNNNGSLHFIFIGNDFFRKGGKESVDILEKYVGKYSFHLTVVSNMGYGDGVYHSTYEDALFYKQKMKEAEWITYYESLPNAEVLEKAKSAHIGLLPTFADTYGYSVLEMQACGCPVITTDIRALPEINSNLYGWMCHLPQNEYKGVLSQTEEERDNLVSILQNQLKVVFEDVFKLSRQELIEKALLNVKRIEEEHNPDRYAQELKKIFSER